MFTISKFKLGILALCMLLLIVVLSPQNVIAETHVMIPDPNLEAVIRECINKPYGELSQTDLAGISNLYARQKQIKTLEGLQYLKNLQVLNLHENHISNIEPLRGLKNLYILDIGYNDIKDFSALSNLTELSILNLSINDVKDISALKNLKKLRDLTLPSNVSDYSPIYDIYKNLMSRNFSVDESLIKNTVKQPVKPDKSNVKNKNGAARRIPVILLDGKVLSFDAPPYLKDGKVMVSMKIFEAFGMTAKWNSAKKMATITKDSTTILITVGNSGAIVNKKYVDLDFPAELTDGKMFIPVRFVSETLGVNAQWNPDTYKLTITKQKRENTNKITSERIYGTNGVLDEFIYYRGGEVVASSSIVSMSKGFVFGRNSNWSIEYSFNRIKSPFYLIPNSIKVKDKVYNIYESDTWKKDPVIVENNLEPVISFIIKDMEESRIRGYF